jgi:hypothetical protein
MNWWYQDEYGWDQGVWPIVVQILASQMLLADLSELCWMDVSIEVAGKLSNKTTNARASKKHKPTEIEIVQAPRCLLFLLQRRKFVQTARKLFADFPQTVLQDSISDLRVLLDDKSDNARTYSPNA